MVWRSEGSLIYWTTTGEDLVSGKIPDALLGTNSEGDIVIVPPGIAARAVAIAIRCAMSQHLVRIGEDAMGFSTGGKS